MADFFHGKAHKENLYISESDTDYLTTSESDTH